MGEVWKRGSLSSQPISQCGLIDYPVTRLPPLVRDRSGAAAKNGEGLGTPIMWGVPNYKCLCTKSESEFLTSQAEYSRFHERLRSCLTVEHSVIKSSVKVDPYVYLTSTWHHSHNKCSRAWDADQSDPTVQFWDSSSNTLASVCETNTGVVLGLQIKHAVNYNIC